MRSPKKDAGGYKFPDYPDFRPNLSPADVLRMGSFGGGYFRPIFSSVVNKKIDDAWEEIPKQWLKGLDVKKQIVSEVYDVSVNKYGVKCGQTLEQWEQNGWIRESDPYGWFQWYCRFFQGRRCEDDDRQVARGIACFGPKGRWRNNLINKILRKRDSGIPLEKAVDDPTISPAIRQTLQHCGYKVTLRDCVAQ